MFGAAGIFMFGAAGIFGTLGAVGMFIDGVFGIFELTVVCGRENEERNKQRKK